MAIRDSNGCIYATSIDDR